MACDNCARLTRELREAKEELAEYQIEAIEPDPVKLLRWLRKPATPQTAALVLHLSRSPGRACQIMDLSDAMGASQTMDPRNGVRVHVARARRCLEYRGMSEVIFNQYGVGFSIERDAAKAIMEAAT